ncbi:unnamed protein product [Lymnaea stagnalis]|uniref:Uncharacterized protein n=1 Tax=Lymnaea stagnalis TaxID=6523 RepID=A0AAV2HDJ7_LYMST
MEELFFSALTGSVQIDNIIPYILRMETAEYNLQMTGQTGAAAVAGITGGIGVPALHDPNAPNQPPSVPILLESSQNQVTLSSSGDGGNNSRGCGDPSSNSTHNTSLGIRASLISDAGQVLTLYTDSGNTSSPQNSTSAT